MIGSYIIVVYLSERITVRVGALGDLDFIRGYYLYVGSAMAKTGSNTLENRINRHLSESNQKKLFWHIDYLLAKENCKISKIYLIPSTIRLECIISNEILSVSDNFVKDFGSSDCRCPSHLYYFTNFTGLEELFN